MKSLTGPAWTDGPIAEPRELASMPGPSPRQNVSAAAVAANRKSAEPSPRRTTTSQWTIVVMATVPVAIPSSGIRSLRDTLGRIRRWACTGWASMEQLRLSIANETYNSCAGKHIHDRPFSSAPQPLISVFSANPPGLLIVTRLPSRGDDAITRIGLRIRVLVRRRPRRWPASDPAAQPKRRPQPWPWKGMLARPFCCSDNDVP